jgi:hypothetical protein
MLSHARRIVALAAVGALIMGACSEAGPDPAEDPKGALVTSIDALQDQEALSVTLSIESDPESLQALGSQSGSELSSDNAQKILDSSLTIVAVKGEDPDDSRAQVVVNVAGNDAAVEMRFLDKTLFVRADAKGLAEEFGQDPASLDALGQQAAAQGLDFVEPALNGEWLAFEGLDQLAQQFGGAAASPNVQQEQLIDDLSEAFKSAAKVTSEGEDDVGTHLVATVPLRDVYEKLLEDAGSLTQAVPGATLPPASEVPDESITVDTWVEDGRLTQVELDFLQFAKFAEEDVPEGVNRLAFKIALNEFDGEITAPEGAVDVDLQELMRSFTGVTGVGGATGTDQGGTAGSGEIPGLPGVSCADLASQDPSTIKAALESDPELLKSVDQACPELGLAP